LREALPLAYRTGVLVCEAARSGEHAEGGGFMERLREFFGAGTPSDETRSSGALLTIDAATPQAIEIVREYGGRTQGDAQDGGDEQHLRVHEERLTVEKERVADGEFRARKEVVTEHQRIDVPVTHEEIRVETQTVGADVRKERVRFDVDVDVESDDVGDSIDRR
jgi:stress response protein YsnF